MSDPINRRDLDIILEVNKKSIEIETEVASQNEEIIELLQENIAQSKTIDTKLSNFISEDNKTVDQFFITDKTILDINNQLLSKNKEIENKIIDYEKENIKKIDKILDNQDDANTAHKNIFAISTKIENKIDQTKTDLEQKIENLNKDMFQLKILFSSGVVSLIIQVIQFLLKK